ncbi:Phosphoribosylformylglycinamidine cyclo-ligase [hydrothermal vent metagenome]|uniref:phosphoribosylformylglycinamidine cyclo-ligase n=1 Tax=hydrothermal vent metagenome TaxID=652676 RepID=A0A3B0RJP9_9ZZZZ
MTYKDAGVDISEGERLVGMIKPLAKSTYTSGVIGGIGGFGGAFSGSFKGLKNPVLISGTDGVGTKLKLAFMADKHDSIGIDLVAMCVNDIVTTGARPLFFLDYFSTGSLQAKKAAAVVRGIAKGCKDAGCALIGGETAEMPGLYGKGEYDLAGFSVGVVDKAKIIDGKKVRPGDAIIGIASSGLHSNGYSLARKVIFEELKLKLSDRPKGLRKTIGSELLTPTRIYVKTVLELNKHIKIKAISHITGGGLIENVPRVLPKDTKAVIEKGSWPVLPIFSIIQKGGNIDEKEMLRAFNCGIGLVLIVAKRDAQKTLDKLERLGERAFRIGTVEERKKGQHAVKLTDVQG